MKKILMLLCALMALGSLPGVCEEPLPSEAAQATAAPVSVSEYTYAEARHQALGLRLLYPSHWENLPGRSTVCFRDSASGAEPPARMAVSVKKLAKRANSEKMTSELYHYTKAIIEQYDSYEIGNLSTDTDFMGKTGYSTIYKAVKGEHEIYGYAIMACVGTKIYAYHFSAAAGEYADMSIVMQHIRDNIKADSG